MNERTDYLVTLDSELAELSEHVQAMLTGDATVDPVVLLALVQSAAMAILIGDSDVPKDTTERARRVIASARREPGRAVVGAVFEALDLEALCKIPPTDSDQAPDWLHDIFELGFLVDVLNGEQRARLVARLELLAGEIMGRDDLEALYETALFLSQIIDLPDEHPVAEVLDAVLASSDWVAKLIENEAPAVDAEALIAAAKARFEAAVSPLDRLVRWGRRLWGELADTLVVPVPVFAASGTEGVQWPAPRVVLAERDGVEVALTVSEEDVSVEVAGGAYDFALEGDYGDGSLVVVLDAWRVDMSEARLVAAAYPWRARLQTVAQRAPGALRAELLRQAEATTSVSLRLELERAAAKVAVPEVRAEVGRVAFVVLPDGSPGYLAHATSAAFGAGAPVAADDAAIIARWVGALVGVVDDGPEVLVDLRLQAAGADVQGESWQLAAALAVISERLGVARPIVASGALGDAVGAVVPVARLDDKRAVVALEVGEAEVLFVEAAGDVRPELARIFGDSWQERLREALGVASAEHARNAMRAWKGFWGRRNTMDAGPLVTVALRHAQAALAAGVNGVHAIEARWVEGACHLHRGESALAAAAFEAVEAMIAATDARALPALLRDELVAYRGIALVDLAQPTAAAALVRPVLVALDARRAAGEVAGDRRFFEVRVQIAGTLQRAAAFADDLDEARWLLRESLGLGLESERARTLSDLAEVERRRGDEAAAVAALYDAREALDAVESESMAEHTGRFLRVFEARAGLVPSGHAVAPPDWGRWPQPIEVLEALLVGPTAELVAWVEAHVQGVSAIHTLTVLGGLCRAALAGRAVQAQLTRLASEVEAPELAELLAAVTRGEGWAVAEWARRCPY